MRQYRKVICKEYEPPIFPSKVVWWVWCHSDRALRE